MMNTFPVLYDSDSLHKARGAFSTIDFVLDRMKGKSGYFYGFYCDGSVRTELKREIPKELINAKSFGRCRHGWCRQCLKTKN